MSNVKAKKKLANYLMILAVMIIIMIVIGGLTRLTGSGLSIVEWQLFKGVIPPFSMQAWQDLFHLYQQSPEFQKVNSFINISEFQSIFWLEYLHRLWGRIIGMIGIALLIASKFIPTWKEYKNKLLGLVALIILQGTMGWIMVKSGLKIDPYVDPILLAVHLLLALFTLIYIFDFITKLNGYSFYFTDFYPARFKLLILTFLLLSTFFYGALVAGRKAGLIYNEFPLMGGNLVPEELLFYNPLWCNFFTNPVTIQWSHRLLAGASWLLTNLFCIYIYCCNRSILAIILLALTNIQVALGIMTLMHSVPLLLAITHQIVGILLLTFLGSITLQSFKSR